MRPNRPRSVVCLLGLAFMALSAGCFSHPLPLHAQKGGSVGVLLAGEANEGGAVGYGSFAYDQMGITDDQRGRLQFTLHDGGQVGPTIDPVLVTRLQADPASLQGIQETDPEGFWLAGKGQVMALIDIPDDPTLVPGPYELQVHRVDRTGAAVQPDPLYRLDITILEGPGTPNPLEAFTKNVLTGGISGPTDVVANGALGRIYPHPKAIFDLPNQVAAARLVFAYNPARIEEILAVFEEQHPGRQGLVLWRQDVPNPGEIEVQLVAPDRDVLFLALVFTLADPEGAGIVDLAQDLVVVEEAYYDVDGNPVVGATTPLGIR